MLRSLISLESRLPAKFPNRLIGELESCEFGSEGELGAWGTTVVLCEYFYVLQLVMLNNRVQFNERFVSYLPKYCSSALEAHPWQKSWLSRVNFNAVLAAWGQITPGEVA